MPGIMWDPKHPQMVDLVFLFNGWIPHGTITRDSFPNPIPMVADLLWKRFDAVAPLLEGLLDETWQETHGFWHGKKGKSWNINGKPMEIHCFFHENMITSESDRSESCRFSLHSNRMMGWMNPESPAQSLTVPARARPCSTGFCIQRPSGTVHTWLWWLVNYPWDAMGVIEVVGAWLQSCSIAISSSETARGRGEHAVTKHRGNIATQCMWRI